MTTTDHITPDNELLLTCEISSSSGRVLADLERSAIAGALSLTQGNRTRAAAILGISLRALRYKIAHHDRCGMAEWRSDHYAISIARSTCTKHLHSATNQSRFYSAVSATDL